MTDPTDDRDQLLSAHLDGRLTPRDEQRVTALLDRDPDSRQALHSMAYTRRLLAETPRPPLPRAFTLHEGMAGVRAPRRDGWLAWLKPAQMRLAAAVVAVLLVVVAVGDVGMRWQTQEGAPAAVWQAPAGGLETGQGDPTGILAAKTPTTEEAAAPSATFLGLAPNALLTLEVGLAVLLILLLAASWRMSRV